VSDDLEQRLAAAAAAVREQELTERRIDELRDRLKSQTAELEQLRGQYDHEADDVRRLEGISLTRVFASLRGSRGDDLARERAEADAAKYRVAEAQARIDALQRECDTAQLRLNQLVGSREIYQAVLDQKEERLRGQDDERGRRLLELADQRGRLAGEEKEVNEAIAAAKLAWQALAQVQDILRSASRWSTYDTFFGGGAVASMIKRGRLDDAADAAARADACLARLRTELADVPSLGPTAPELAMGPLTRFADVWFDNIFTDLAVRDRIQQAQANVFRSIDIVRTVHNRLTQRLSSLRTTRGGLDVERDQLVLVP
jgi:hypothetical protein